MLIYWNMKSTRMNILIIICMHLGNKLQHMLPAVLSPSPEWSSVSLISPQKTWSTQRSVYTSHLLGKPILAISDQGRGTHWTSYPFITEPTNNHSTIQHSHSHQWSVWSNCWTKHACMWEGHRENVQSSHRKSWIKNEPTTFRCC